MPKSRCFRTILILLPVFFSGELLKASDPEHKNDISSILLAQSEYVQPNTPPLYESNGAPGTPLKFRSGLYVGGNLGFGLSRNSGGDANSIPSYTAGGEIGYVAGTGSWSRFEVALEAMFGKVGHSRASLPIGGGAIIKIGRGYSLGNKFFGVWQLGAGLAQAKYSGTTSQGVDVTSVDPVVGTILRVGYSIVMPMGNFMSMIGGVSWTFMTFNITEGVLDDSSSDRAIDLDQQISLNIPAVQVGIRLGI